MLRVFSVTIPTTLALLLVGIVALALIRRGSLRG